MLAFCCESEVLIYLISYRHEEVVLEIFVLVDFVSSDPNLDKDILNYVFCISRVFHQIVGESEE